jgi:glycogenin glucosyltransferase
LQLTHFTGRPDLNTVLTKLHVFRLVQFSKIIFLDADVLPIRPLSHLFTLPHDFSAVPDVGWPDIFNSGVMVLSPGEDKFTQLSQLYNSKGSWDGGDQGILNEWRGNNWNRLSFIYNTTPTAAYTSVFPFLSFASLCANIRHRYAPAYERFGSQISAIHFIGPNKPWNSLAYRAPFTNQSSSDSPQQAYDYGSLLDRWYSVYDEHYRSETNFPQPAPEVKRYESAWNETLDRGKQAALPTGSTLNLEELRKLAIEGMKAAPPTFHDKSGEGEYQSMPLGGRVDLMRPTKTEDAAEPAGVDVVPEQKTLPPVLQTMSDPEELPQTPVLPEIQLQRASPPLWLSQATPGPDEVPPSPQLKNIPLPLTPTPTHPPTNRHHYHPVVEHQALPAADEPQEQREQPTSQQEYSPLGQQQQRDSEPPPRPRSPPLLIWNPAVDPPPTATPTPSAFPSDTYFPNVWDQTPSKQHDHTHQSSSVSPDFGAFFQPPPPAEIPEVLLRQGHYRNVTGESNMSSPSPDRAKVKSVFPWEEKPRHLPGRVFPVSDSPRPSLFLSPESQPSSSEAPVTPERKTIAPVLSPLSGLPSTLTYANAWDNVPSIQKYASWLVRPPAPRSLAPAFDEDGWRKRKSWEDKAEVSSRDGDVEDEGEESIDEDAPKGSVWGEEHLAEALSRRSKRGSSVSRIDNVSERKKYRAFGVQTTSCDTRSIGVQVDTIHSKTDRLPDRDRRPSMSGNRHWAPSGRSNVPPSVTTHAVSTRSEATSTSNPGSSGTASQSPPPATSGRSNVPPFLTAHTTSIQPEISPISQSGSLRTTSPSVSPGGTHTFSPSSTITRPFTETATPPLSTISGAPHSPSVIARPPSNDSWLESPASSLGPLSPTDGQPISTPVRKAGRVWDPARGVDLVKRGSEEVLARFLRMGPWDHENR